MNFLSTLLAWLGVPELQVPQRTNDFFQWYFYGLGGIGGWIIFFLMAFIAVIWLIYNSQKRRLSATGWRMAVVVLMLLLVPTLLYRFTVTPVHYEIYQLLQLYIANCTIDLFAQFNLAFNTCEQLRNSLPAMTPYSEIVFYLGLMGGILSVVAAAGYYISFQGLVGCAHGHVYESVLGKCPECAANEIRISPPPPPPLDPRRVANPPDKTPHRPQRPCLNYAWLVDLENNRRYDLYEGATMLGRSSSADLHLADPAVGREHAKVRETNGYLTLTDLDSRSGTFLNGKRIRNPQVLQNGDRIVLGDTELQFVITK